MNQEMIKALSDKELSQFIILAQQEVQSREEKREFPSPVSKRRCDMRPRSRRRFLLNNA